MDKSEVRKMMRELKRELNPDERLRRSAAVATRLERLPQFVAARVVLLYWSMADEVQTHALVERWHRDKVVLLPCVDGDDLLLRQYTGPQCMVAGEQFGIGEPSADTPLWTDLEAIDLIAVPGVAFDNDCNRMGRGRGFYDRLLAGASRAFKVGLAYDFQMLDAIPVEPHDVKMDCVVTENSQF